MVCTVMHEFGHACICRYLQSSNVNITVFLNNSPPYRLRQSLHLVLVGLTKMLASSLALGNQSPASQTLASREAGQAHLDVYGGSAALSHHACMPCSFPTEPRLQPTLLYLIWLVGWLVASLLCVHICMHVPCDAHLEVRKQLGVGGSGD